MIQGDGAEAETGVGDVDPAVVRGDVLQQTRRLVSYGWGALGPGSGGELLHPAPQVLQYP